MASTALCLALIGLFAVGYLAHAEAALALASQDGAKGPARKLLGSPMMMSGMSMSPMAMSMSPMMMSPAMAPMNMPVSYNLTLMPSTEVPPVNSAASGMCMLTFMDMSIKYNLTVMNLVAPTMAHIHVGSPGNNGAVAAYLYNSTMMAMSTTPTNGVLATGTIMSKDFVGPAKGMTVMAFYNKYVATGMAYVNVHTTKHPEGELRGYTLPSTMVKTA